MSRFVVVDDKDLMFHIVPSYFWTNLIHHLKRKEKKKMGVGGWDGSHFECALMDTDHAFQHSHVIRRSSIYAGITEARHSVGLNKISFIHHNHKLNK